EPEQRDRDVTGGCAQVDRRDGHGTSLRDVRPARPAGCPGRLVAGRRRRCEMQVLVTVASRHGSTREIGEVVAEVLRNSGFDVDVADPDEVEDLDRYDAVVLGSSVYLGRWAASARALVDRLTMR